MGAHRHVYNAATLRSESADLRAAAATDVLGYQSLSEVENLPTIPPLEVAGGPEVEAADFVTGSVSLNRMQRRIEELSFEEKRSLIYGGDMIVP